MPVFLILFCVVLLGLGAGAAVVLLGIFLVLTPGRGRRALALSLALLAALLAVRFGGEWILALLGLSWRRRVQGALLFAAGAAFLLVARHTHQAAGARLDAAPWVKGAVPLCTELAVLGMVVLGGAGVFFGAWRDRVVEGNEWTDQKAVVEITGFFRETGYRYVNPLVKGEQLYEWED